MVRENNERPNIEPVEVIIGNKEKIFIIDDDDLVRDTLEFMTKKLNYQPRCFSCSEEAIESINNNGNIDLIISDLAMPGIGGLGIAEKLDNKLPILFVSGMFQAEDIEKIISNGHDYLEKPFEKVFLSRKIGEILQKNKKNIS